ncbi:beta-beta-alpha zinc fingers domain-containing protein [Dioscorea alata]|uniref:Beta-beta-alpha zinc fingers domain-containing protein n=1 Tax=Dioscorea alata TaxID=55571 RepID=A0ACB7WU37_DIOAL|nr:beta-beta-alpha zinc fingers domain-containing protein [Dioscorea alata]
MATEDNMVVFEENQVVENDNNNDNHIPEIKRFNCKFCDQTFTTGQALGGHQNCHRAQRNALKLAVQPNTAVLVNPNHRPIMPSHFSHDPVSPLPFMQPPSSLHSFDPECFQPPLTITQPRYDVHVSKEFCSGHGVGSSSGGDGSNNDNAMRLRLGKVNEATRPHEVNFQALLKGTKYYEEECKNKDGDELDLTLHL